MTIPFRQHAAEVLTFPPLGIAANEIPAPRIVQVGPQVPPAPSASLRAQGAPLRGRVPPMDYLDNPERRRTGQPSDATSANSYGFRPASTWRYRAMPRRSARRW